jgi:RNA polymerase sigma factor (sigma-70 family)
MSELLQAQRIARPILARILRNRPDDVDDVLQTASLRAFDKMGQFEHRSKFSSWFVRIAIRSALMHLRTKEIKHEHQYIPVDDLDKLSVFDQETPEDFVIRKELEDHRRERLHKAIRLLTPKRQRTIYAYLEDRHTNTSAEKGRLHAARVQLKMILTGEKA